MLPVLAKVFRRRQRPVGRSWRVDETYVQVGGQWKYLYRAVDKLGHAVDFLLTARRDVAAARRFFERAIDLHDVPEKITIDKSGANTAAVRGLIADSGVAIELRQSKYLNNIVEQDHRAIKRRVRPMMGFKTFHTARRLITGIETMHMIRKGQMSCPKGSTTCGPSVVNREPRQRCPRHAPSNHSESMNERSFSGSIFFLEPILIAPINT